MSGNQITHGDVTGASGTGKPRVPRRTWIVWAAIFCGIVLLMLFKDRMEPPGDTLSQFQFEQLVDAGQIVRATINYAPQGSALNEVVGIYTKQDNDTRVQVPFRAKVRLAGGLERKLLSLPQFEPREPNTMLFNFVVSVLPIVVIAVLIWFFFIRQIKRVTRSSHGTTDLQAKAGEQQARFDGILDKWERQASRMDAILDRMERDTSVKK
jgi:ATP-dependent Zn protease